MSEITLTSQNFQQEVLESRTPVLVDFWATWCGPCKMLSPIVEEIAAEYDGKLKVGKVNVDDEGALAAKFGIMSIPTVIFFKDGAIAESFVGYRPKAEIEEIIAEII